MTIHNKINIRSHSNQAKKVYCPSQAKSRFDRTEKAFQRAYKDARESENFKAERSWENFHNYKKAFKSHLNRFDFLKNTPN